MKIQLPHIVPCVELSLHRTWWFAFHSLPYEQARHFLQARNVEFTSCYSLYLPYSSSDLHCPDFKRIPQFSFKRLLRNGMHFLETAQKRSGCIKKKGQECEISKCFCAVCLLSPQWLVRRAPKSQECWSQMIWVLTQHSVAAWLWVSCFTSLSFSFLSKARHPSS